ncbi:MAG: transcription elongation factor GreA [Chlorobiaceae bacterium]|nr:transcription elongation factor GreA [Chlorobiaceae bacterium]MBA4309264.1 transcription elongation factor GreA [Chlorobiaceae bacterium]
MNETKFVYLTQARIVQLEKELQSLKINGRKEIAQKIADARAHGDLSENAEYDAAKEEQGLFELKIARLADVLSRAKVIDTSKFDPETIHILSEVEVKNLKTNKVYNYCLVSPEEADFQKGKISITSPVGQGLLGKKLGEKIKVNAPAGILEFEILSLVQP